MCHRPQVTTTKTEYLPPILKLPCSQSLFIIIRKIASSSFLDCTIHMLAIDILWHADQWYKKIANCNDLPFKLMLRTVPVISQYLRNYLPKKIQEVQLKMTGHTSVNKHYHPKRPVKYCQR